MVAELGDREFAQLSTLIYTRLGIKMSESKRTMLNSRLSKRLRELGFASFGRYCEFLFSERGMAEEMVHLINAVTTNKTDFYREPAHFDALRRTVLPTLEACRGPCDGRRPLKVWSAGCSTGEEPYTLAMVLAEIQVEKPGFAFEILATDISTRVLEVAKRAVYPADRVTPVPPAARKRYLLRRRDPKIAEVRIVPELRRLVRFGRLNFMADEFGLSDPVDIIFCRNVIIYFDRETQERLITRFSRYLHRGGYLFLGHSETLHGYQTPFVQVAPTIYRRP